MNFPKICTKSTSFDNDRAGWYTPNSMILNDIRPDWRTAGGGVVENMITDLPTALNNAISYTKQRMAEAERHLKKLETAKEEITP